MEPANTAGIALLCMVGAGLGMGTTLAVILLHRLHLEAQAETAAAVTDRVPPDPARPVAANRA